MDTSRRDFLKLFFSAVSTAAISGLTMQDISVFVLPKAELSPLPEIETGGLIRPPGALTEKAFRSRCISCGVCVNVCHVMKYDAIAVAGITPPDSSITKGGLREILNFGSPYIKDMRDFPCALCMECPGHCPTGALQKIEKERVNMGMALIDFGLCFGWNGDVCLSCSKACPMGAQIFDFYHGQWGNQPYINENCVGCGLCVKYCPLGGSAVKVITKGQYQKVKAQYLGGFNDLLEMQNEERYNIVYSRNLPDILARGKIIEREYR